MVTAALRPDRFLRRTLPALAAAAAVLLTAAHTDAFTPGSGGWGFSAVPLHTWRPAPLVTAGAGAAWVLAGGERHTLAVANDGSAWAWGWNGYGQLGLGDTVNRSVPVRIQGISGVMAAAAGYDHTLALRSDGTVWAWGRNDSGQLGLGDMVNRAAPAPVPGLTGVTAVAAGSYHSLAIRSDGTLWVWGWNGYGQLGLGDTVDRASPVQVPVLSGVTAASGGGGYTVALRTDGTVWAWGRNAYGQLGLGDTATRTSPVQVPGLTGVVAVAAGGGFTVALRSDGTVWAWGRNDVGQLGLGDTVNRLSPVQVTSLSGVAGITVGVFHALALRTDGTVWAWGRNDVGQLGLGDTVNRLSPVQVPGLTSMTGVQAGAYHSLACRHDGTLWAWGRNEVGQLGLGDTVNRTVPAQVTPDAMPPEAVWGVWVPAAISPNGDGVQEQAGIAYTLSGPATVTVRVVDGAGTPVRTLVTNQAQSGTVPATWNGRNGSNQPAPDGQYRLRLDAVDGVGNAAVLFSPWLVVDAAPPGITGLAAVPPAFSPNGDGIQDSTAVTFSLSEPGAVTVQVKDAGGQVVRTLWNAVVQSQGPTQVTWNGRNDAGSLVADGQYTVAVDLMDNAGNASPTATAPVTVDRAAPALTNLTAAPAVISPNGDGIQDSTAVSFSLAEAAAVTVEVKNAGGQVVRTLWQQLPRQPGSHTVVWDGKDGSGAPVPAGAYTAAVRAVDAAGNTAAGAAPVTVEAGTLEVTAPAAFAWNASLTGQDLAVLDWQSVAVADQTGTGSGWRLLLALTPLVTSAGEPLPDATLHVNGSAASPSAPAPPQAACAAQGSCVAPSPTGVSFPVVLTPGAPPVRVYNAAAGTGLGSVLVDGAFWLRVPARAKAGTYSGTLTFSVASGP